MRKLPFIMMLLLMAGACAHRSPDLGRTAARTLYSRTLRILESYGDSVLRARDSASLSAMMERLDKSVTSLNYGFPPETDMHMTEDENDTLAMLSLRIAGIRDSLLYVYAHPSAVSDSLAADSVADTKSGVADNVSRSERARKTQER